MSPPLPIPDGMRLIHCATTDAEGDLLRQVLAEAGFHPEYVPTHAGGLTGIFGYASTTLSGVGFGKLVQTYGWNAGFIGMLIVAAIGTFACALGWRAKAHGYGD